MSSLAEITKQLTSLTNTVNALINKAKKTNELTHQEAIEITSLIRVFHSGVSKYISIDQILQVGVGDKNHIHDQGVSSSLWNVQHGLNKFPSVTIVDTAGNEIEGYVEHIDINSYNITFNAAFSGKSISN